MLIKQQWRQYRQQKNPNDLDNLRSSSRSTKKKKYFFLKRNIKIRPWFVHERRHQHFIIFKYKYHIFFNFFKSYLNGAMINDCFVMFGTRTFKLFRKMSKLVSTAAPLFSLANLILYKIITFTKIIHLKKKLFNQFILSINNFYFLISARLLTNKLTY